MLVRESKQSTVSSIAQMRPLEETKSHAITIYVIVVHFLNKKHGIKEINQFSRDQPAQSKSKRLTSSAEINQFRREQPVQNKSKRSTISGDIKRTISSDDIKRINQFRTHERE
jgi:hypothetical protein